MDPAPAHAPEAQTAESTLKEAGLGKRLLALTLTFGKFGGITFGGGYAIVALLEEDLVRKKGWLTQDELFNIITVGESTPGPIAVNTATFVGYRLAGILGGFVATTALVFPAWLVIVIVSGFYLQFRENVWVAAALGGIRVAAIVLIVRAFLRMGHGVPRNKANAIAFGLAFLLVAVLGQNALWVVVGGLLYGVLWYGVRPRLKGEKA